MLSGLLPKYAQCYIHFTQRQTMHPATAMPFLVALASGATGLALAVNHPAGSFAAGSIALLCWIAFFSWQHLWLIALPALLPVLGFAPWTGWITFEEVDILIFVVAAGGYLRMAFPLQRIQTSKTTGRGQGQPTLLWLIVGLFAASVIASMFRGFSDAGGFGFGWFQGYHEPMNSVRLGKSFLQALLLVPLWRSAMGTNPDQTNEFLSLGLTLGLGASALTTVWERAAFTGLLNFSSDYRTTGLFWEMHVGGAALDGFLALTVPFAIRELISARSPTRGSIAGCICALAAYACLTTFSRGVYLAVPIGMTVFFVLHTLQRRCLMNKGLLVDSSSSSLQSGFLVIGFGLIAGWMFQTSGYRGAVSLLGVIALALPLAPVLRSLPGKQWMIGSIGGLFIAAIAAGLTWLIPKGAYITYILGFVSCALMITAQRRHPALNQIAGPGALAAFIATAVAVVFVADHWGGSLAVLPATASAAVCMAIALIAGRTKRPVWPTTTHWQAIILGLMGLTIGTVGVFSGGAYMGDRFSTGSRDLTHRLDHWALGTNMLQSPADLWLGKGLGRFPSNYFMFGDPQEHPGDYRLQQEGNERYLRLTGGLHVHDGWDQVLRLTQRVSEPGIPTTVSSQVRTANDISLRFELCEKHLLYNAACITREVGVKAAPDKWQAVSVELRGEKVSHGPWYAPRMIAFSVAVGTGSGIAELDKLQLNGRDGRNMLTNGGFSDGLAHWFFSSDKHHLPWHIKNMPMHVLFDQGIIGLALWVTLLGGVLLRLSTGKARAHPLAPVLAASLVGFTIVGMFDSLLDVPRIATLFYFLAMIGLTLRKGGSSADRGRLMATEETNPPKPRYDTYVKPGRLAVLSMSLLAIAMAISLLYFTKFSDTDLSRTPLAEWVRSGKPWLSEHVWLGAALLPSLEAIQDAIEPPPATGSPRNQGKVRADTWTDSTATKFLLQVGPNRGIKTIAQAAGIAKAGSTVEVDAGEYVDDVAVWTQDRLTLRAMGGRVKLIARGTLAQAKAIWVIRGEHVSVEGFDFVGARASEKNGAGIRFEKGSLRVKDCTFTENENGILTSNQADSELEIENSEFGYNGNGDGLSHNLYVGEIAQLSVTGSYFHHAKIGHLLKSRAAVNRIYYNRLTDETGGSASYELEFPNGGTAYVVGNIIQQGSQTSNRRIISYGVEGNKWVNNELYLVNNTLVDNGPQGGVFLHIRPSGVIVKAMNNILVGNGRLESAGPGDYRNNFAVDWDEFEFAAREDYSLKPDSSLLGKEMNPGSVNGQSLLPDRTYIHPHSTAPLSFPVSHPGALQNVRGRVIR